MGNLKIKTEENSKKYEKLLHYCSIQTLERILHDKTLRCSSLGYIQLNDKFERQRKGIEQYANDFFISCFSNYQQEIVPFWYNYAGDNLKEKVLLKFTNFADKVADCFKTNYFLTSENRKMFFLNSEYTKTINQNGIIGKSLNLSPINIEYDLKNSIKHLIVRDVEYLPISANVFTKQYKEVGEITFDGGRSCVQMPISDLRTFGYYKSEHWGYEHETRVICSMLSYGITQFDYILLRLQDAIFDNLTIVENPWSDSSFRTDIIELISNSPIDETIKATISVEKSQLNGLLKE